MVDSQDFLLDPEEMIGKHDLQINDGPELLSLEALQQRGRWHHRTRIIDAKFKAGFFRFTAR